ncbi:MAG TPA: hypothetical protein VN837_17095 [Chloroflexota bacterium]|nr:hypothetical protein [Chloroflexota bacterium]
MRLTHVNFHTQGNKPMFLQADYDAALRTLMMDVLARYHILCPVWEVMPTERARWAPGSLATASLSAEHQPREWRSPRVTSPFSDSSPPPRLSRPISGSNTTNWPAFRIARFLGDREQTLYRGRAKAGFRFGFIEQGGSSLYPSLAQRVTNPEVLRILLSIGPTETTHFQTWHDKAGNYVPLTDPTNGLVFPDLSAAPRGGEDLQTNLIMPEPTIFLSRKFPVVSIIRPNETRRAAMGAIKAFTDDGLFIGQPPEFLTLLHDLASAADAAGRGM